MKPRYGFGQTVHAHTEPIISNNEEEYKLWLERIKAHADSFKLIQENKVDEINPFWDNGFFPGLDIMITFSMLDYFKPKQYVEAGSGNSTKVAAFAKKHCQLDTKIISIDPNPRAEIKSICDQLISKPMENALIEIAELNLEAGDILFIDNSHCSFPNSDVTVFFMELLPTLKKGVILQIHDIFLPSDYPQEMVERGYSEQYLLGTALMHAPDRYHILFPAYYVSQTNALINNLDDFWKLDGIRLAEKIGSSFWMTIN